MAEKLCPRWQQNRVANGIVAIVGSGNEPKGACQQQGLHFIYAQTCREKRCIDCMPGKQDDLRLPRPQSPKDDGLV